MNDKVLKEIIRISNQLPGVTMDRIIQLLGAETNTNIRRRALLREFGDNLKVQQLLKTVDTEKKISLENVALILKTTQLLKQDRERSNVSLVWSGPDFPGVPMRKTEQVVLEMIDNAERELFISSFAVYKIQDILNHLEWAIQSEVIVNMLLETPQSSHHKIRHDPLELFSEYLRENGNFYIWPYKNRSAEQDKIIGALHAKFVMQDKKVLFVSSANLTGSALERNIELGVLIENEKISQNLDSQLRQLIFENVITRV